MTAQLKRTTAFDVMDREGGVPTDVMVGRSSMSMRGCRYLKFTYRADIHP